MQLILLARYWAQITIAILCLLLLFAVSSCSSKEREIKLLISEHQLTLTTKEAAYELRARQIEKAAHEQTIQAINDAKVREKAIAVDVANAHSANERLSDTIDRLAANAATDAEFRIKYASTTGNLLKECSSEYIGLAATADRIANDLRTIQQANKR